jgi:hypothetical protein
VPISNVTNAKLEQGTSFNIQWCGHQIEQQCPDR